jgi:putative transposase
MTSYPTDMTNSQWQIISKYLDTQRSRKYELRQIVNAILYVVKTGCQWRMLPSDFAKWKIFYYYFSTWKEALIIEHIHEELVKKTRKTKGKNEEPTIGIIDAQSVKNTLVSIELAVE